MTLRSSARTCPRSRRLRAERVLVEGWSRTAWTMSRRWAGSAVPANRVNGDRRRQVGGIGWEFVHVAVDDATRLGQRPHRSLGRKPPLS